RHLAARGGPPGPALRRPGDPAPAVARELSAGSPVSPDSRTNPLDRRNPMPTLRIRWLALALTEAIACPHAAAAAPISITAADQRDVTVTIYNGNLGLVREPRELRLEPGVVEARYADVAAQID